MELKNSSKLSDAQLIELYRNPTTNTEIKKAIANELDARDVKTYFEDNLTTTFTYREKIRLLAFPFAMGYHRRVMLGKNWTRQRDKTFWHYISMGFAIYLVTILILGLLFR
ncbi:hypothetical protein [Lacinutrix chionoecetis]